MDPITALGLAANVLQFIDFATKLFAVSREIYRSGESVRSLHLGLIVDDLESVTRKLKRSGSPETGSSLDEDDKVCPQKNSSCS
jgi:hypothetical protein